VGHAAAGSRAAANAKTTGPEATGGTAGHAAVCAHSLGGVGHAAAGSRAAANAKTTGPEATGGTAGHAAV
jgi:hypothetical protein